MNEYLTTLTSNPVPYIQIQQNGKINKKVYIIIERKTNKGFLSPKKTGIFTT